MVGFKHAIGSKAKDKVSSYEGIIIGRSEWFYGCRRYILQSQSLKDGIPVASYSVDEDAIQIIESAKDKEPNFKYELGSKVRDKATTCEGVIQARTQWLYSSNRYNIQSQILKDGLPAEQIGVEEKAIEVIKAEEPHKMKKSGGPSGVAARSQQAK